MKEEKTNDLQQHISTDFKLKLADKYEIRIGKRTIKTGISVMISVLICQLLQRTSPAIAALASVFTLRQDSMETWKFTKVRIFSNVLGAIVAVGFVFLYKFFPTPSLAMLILLPLGVVIIIVFCDTINQNMAIIGASSTFLVLLITNSEILSVDLVLQRVIDTFIGSIVSIIINHLLWPQKNNKL